MVNWNHSEDNIMYVWAIHNVPDIFYFEKNEFFPDGPYLCGSAILLAYYFSKFLNLK